MDAALTVFPARGRPAASVTARTMGAIEKRAEEETSVPDAKGGRRAMRPGVNVRFGGGTPDATSHASPSERREYPALDPKRKRHVGKEQMATDKEATGVIDEG